MEKFYIFMSSDDRVGIHVVATHPREAFERFLAFLDAPRIVRVDGEAREIKTGDFLIRDDAGSMGRMATMKIGEQHKPLVDKMRSAGYVVVVVYSTDRVATAVLLGRDDPATELLGRHESSGKMLN